MSTLSKSSNLGERLEEARKRKGVSLREAAEATKLRTDYLQSMENNIFDIPLPPVYQRGFLRNYAKYLKLDPERVMADYEALQITLNRTPRRDSRGEPLAKMDVSDSAVPSQSSAGANRGADLSDRSSPEPLEFDKTLWLKIGLIIGCCSLLALVVVVVIRMVGQNGTPAESAEPAPASGQYAVANPVESAVTTSTTAARETISLIATDAVTVIVEQAIDRTRLFAGTLNAGETRMIEKTGAIVIRYTNGSALEVDKGGKRYKMGASGVGFSKVP
ncbi:MAG: helix-turn-helix domain-containing protein [Verrucomicrobiota bacterium]|nr:helix-turn-helix domain-containing protein [Verrucomicrobiota bacterium]